MMLPFNLTSMLIHSGKFLIMPPGRVRPTHMVSTEMEHQSTVLSLSVFPPHYQKVPGDDRYRKLSVAACSCFFVRVRVYFDCYTLQYFCVRVVINLAIAVGSTTSLKQPGTAPYTTQCF